MSIQLTGMTGNVTSAPNDLGRAVTEEELAKALSDVIKYTNMSTDFNYSTAVYYTPSQQLRNQADAIEKQDAEIFAARLVLNSYNKYNNKEEK
jgi:hypothetical protein